MYIQMMMAMPPPMEWNRPSSGLNRGSMGLKFQFMKPTTVTAPKATRTRPIKTVSSFSSQSRPMMLTMVKITTITILAIYSAVGDISMNLAA